jgi:hypothetical protein
MTTDVMASLDKLSGMANQIADQRNDLLRVLTTLLASLAWEAARSGTTYAGYDDAFNVMARVRAEMQASLK